MTRDRTAEAVTVYFGRTKERKYVAATCVSPYFFVEADSEIEAHACAEEAIRLYSENRDNVVVESSPNTGQASHLPTLTDVTSELMYA